VIRPQEVSARLTAPERAEPGAEIAVRVEADRPCGCLLAVYDVRLEHESPLPKLGKQLYDAIRTGTAPLREQTVASLSKMPWGWGSPLGPYEMVYRSPKGLRSGPVFAAAPRMLCSAYHRRLLMGVPSSGARLPGCRRCAGGGC